METPEDDVVDGAIGDVQRMTDELLTRARRRHPGVEFSIAIDPVTTMRIEDVLKELQQELTIVLVTNLVQQARRLSRHTLFLFEGDVVEVGPTDEVFSDRPRSPRTRDYVQGAFG